MSGAAALRLDGMRKRYGAVAALDGVSLAVEAGTVHALVGENGAGKSTLLGVAGGTVRADAGRIVIRGAEVPVGGHEPSAAIAAGVGMVHQHFMLVPTLTVAENVVLGREPRGPLLRLAAVAAEIAALGRRLGLEVDPHRRVDELSVGERQRVEIVKVLWRGAELILLDEPTAVLAPPEVAGLLAVVRALRDAGRTVVLVTHRLDEVTEVADRVTVLRRGRVAAEFERGAGAAEIARAVVGGTAGSACTTPAPAPTPSTGADALEVRELRVGRAGRGDAVAGVSLTVRPGEVLGIAGVAGNGQAELCEAIAGLARAHAGRVRLGGRDVTRLPPAARLELGLAHVPEDRRRRGLIAAFSLAENLLLGRQRELTRRGLVDRRRLEALARERLAAFDVRPADPGAPAAALSGGNQQKLVVARELGRPGLTLALCVEPTRGVDVGAAATIRAAIRAAASAGAGVLLVSSDLAELRALAGRIAVMFRGRIAATLPVADATDEALGALMTGARAAPAEAAS